MTSSDEPCERTRFVEPRSRRGAACLVVAAGTLVAAATFAYAPVPGFARLLALVTLVLFLVEATACFNRPLDALEVAPHRLDFGPYERHRGDTTGVAIVARASTTGAVVTRLLLRGPAGIEVWPLSSLRVGPADLLSALVRSGWPIPGSAVTGGRVLRVPTGAVVVTRAARDFSLVALAALTLLAFDAGGSPPIGPALLLAVVAVGSVVALTVSSLSRLGWASRVRVAPDGVVIETARGVVTLPASEIAALGVVKGSFAARTAAGRVIRLMPPTRSRILTSLAAAATAAGHRWDPDLGRLHPAPGPSRPRALPGTGP